MTVSHDATSGTCLLWAIQDPVPDHETGIRAVHAADSVVEGRLITGACTSRAEAEEGRAAAEEGRAAVKEGQATAATDTNTATTDNLIATRSLAAGTEAASDAVLARTAHCRLS